jgi:hypothetical protein
MSGLEQPNTSYVIISGDNMDALTSVLWSKEYNILPVKGYYEGVFEDSVMAFKQMDNDDLRRDVIMLLDHYNQKSAIIKYLGETVPKKIFFNGEERPMEVVMFNTDSKNKSYLHNGISFSFVEKTRYWIPNKKEELSVGMIVEYMNNNKWYQKKIHNLDDEWDKMLGLLSKYKKLRVEML